MSIIVKGMKMPDSCAVCSFAGKGGYHMERVVCMFTGKNEDAVKVDRLPDCPLVALPDKHGRLGDLDELKTAFPRCDNNMNVKIASVRATINHMDTIVESEDSE